MNTGARVIAQVNVRNGVRSVSYMHDDHLGSTQLTTDAGGVVARKSFDTFGKPRNPAAWNQNASGNTSSVSRSTIGFTGHEDDGEYGLVNMQGRIYDPKARQFLTADPYVQLPLFAPSLNRYSYVLNNPLKYVDPIDLPEETMRLLEVVGAGSAEHALLELVERASQGVTRPGCWERPWLRQVFGDEWTDELEEDPEAYWRQRPRRR